VNDAGAARKLWESVSAVGGACHARCVPSYVVDRYLSSARGADVGRSQLPAALAQAVDRIADLLAC
jgi:hypothetical protein